MKSQLPSASPGGLSLKNFALTAGALSLLLALLFHKSFEADQTLFSNDGPLGALASEQYATAPSFTGAWADLNWIGSKLPSAAPDATSLVSLLLGPILFSKFSVPFALLFLGMSAWIFFRQLGFHPVVAALGGCAISLNTDPFSYACWGLSSLPLTLSATFLAFAAIAKLSPQRVWPRAILAGCAVGLGIMEGFDTGAILSLYVAAFALFQFWHHAKRSRQNPQLALAFLAAIAMAAAITAGHTLSTLIDTQIKGVSDSQQPQDSKEQQWNFATQWSLPKIEALRLIIPGLFGYRLDTPDGGAYWGAVGRQPGWEQHKQGYIRHSGAGTYAGILVVLVAFWALHQSIHRAKGCFDDFERRSIWFWGIVALISLLLSFGRHAPFYQFIYALPYFSTIRNPIKFLHPFSIAIVIVFAYGLQGLWRRFAQTNSRKSESLKGHLRTWWASAGRWDKKWTTGSIVFFLLSLLGWLLYTSSTRELQQHLATVGFSTVDNAVATPVEIARFSIKEVGWYVLFLGMSVALLAVIVSGWFSGARMKLAAVLLGALLIADFARANSPWIIYYDYEEKYASNPILDILRAKPHEHRVAGRLNPFRGPYLESNQGGFSGIYNAWLQAQFPYYNIQSLDIVQMPRTPRLDDTYLSALSPATSNPVITITSAGRLWQLTGTRYLLGMRGFVEPLNQYADPQHRRFGVLSPFDFALKKSGVSPERARLEDLTTVASTNGPFALIEFTGALPRAKLYTNWQVATNDQAALATLTNPVFDPEQTVLVSTPVPHTQPGTPTSAFPAGSVTITSYSPKQISLESQSQTDTVLLLNDRYHPDWTVSVDGQPGTLLRCNYIMRGVSLPHGQHSVEFKFAPPVTWLYVSLASVLAALALCGWLAFTPARPRRSEPSPGEEPPAAPSKTDTPQSKIGNLKSEI